MISFRPSADRGHANFGWLDSRHSFSFGTYHDPAHMGFSDLRVINQDIVQPGAGFATHGHQDMEIITYVLSGALAHRDSLGNVETIQAGELQRMTAGTGVQHSEYNASDRELVEFLQIWILPESAGLNPGYQQIALEDVPGWQVVASRTGAAGALTVHQDMRLLRGRFKAGETSDVPLPAGRNGWLQMVKGEINLQDRRLGPGDAARIDRADTVWMTAALDCEILLFDLK